MNPIPYYLKATLLGVSAVLIGLQLFFWIGSAMSLDAIALTDFPHHYRVGKMLASGRAAYLYEVPAGVEQQIGTKQVTPELSWNMPYLHPAFEAPLFASVSFLPMHKAYLLWLAINAVVMLCVYRILLPHLPTLASMRGWIPASLLAFAYVPRAALHGQDSVILLLVLCGAFSFIAKGDLFATGVILGLGNFRFQHMLVIVGLFLTWKAWKLAAGYFASGIGCALASVAVTGLKPQIEYVHLLHRATTWHVVEDMHNLRAMFALFGMPESYSLILVLCFLAASAYFGRRLSRRDQFVLAIVAMILGSYYILFYDLAVLYLPVVIFLEEALSKGRTRLASFAFIVFAAPVWILLVVKVDQPQAVTAVVIVFFVVLAATRDRTSYADSSRHYLSQLS